MRKSILDALFPKTRQAILSACLLHPEKWWYLSDLASHLGLSPSSLQRELASLTEADLLQSRKEGNRVFYKVNPLCPGVRELQSLLIKTAGVADIVKVMLKKHLAEIDLAFIYGSIARGEEIASSDIDVMIVGNLKLSDLAPDLKKAEKSLGREVNPTIYSRRIFARKANEDDSFIKTVREDEKIFLKGDSNELEALVR